MQTPKKATIEEPLDATLLRIAKEKLFIETLEERKSDRLDFHDVSVWGVRAALEAAYQAGQAGMNESLLGELQYSLGALRQIWHDIDARKLTDTTAAQNVKRQIE